MASLAVCWNHISGILKGESVKWPPSDANVRKAIKDLISKWIDDDLADLAQTLVKALSDGKIEDDEVGDLLVRAAGLLPDGGMLGKAFKDELIEDLEDGKLTTREVLEVGAAVAAAYVPEKLGKLLQLLVKQGANSDSARDAIIAALLNAVKGALGDPTEAEVRGLLVQDQPEARDAVALLTTVYTGKKPDLDTLGETADGQRKTIEQAIKKLGVDELRELVEAILGLRDKTPAQLAVVLLKALGLREDQQILAAVASGRFRDLFKSKLTDLVKGLGNIEDGQAAALADFIIRVLEGTEDLIPKKSEADELWDEYVVDDEEYRQVWVPLRRVLYAAVLGATGGPIVPTDAMARPHVFSAAKMGIRVRLGSLVEQNKWEFFVALVNGFARAEFGDRIPKSAVPLKPSMGQMKVIDLHFRIRNFITCG